MLCDTFRLLDNTAWSGQFPSARVLGTEEPNKQSPTVSEPSPPTSRPPKTDIRLGDGGDYYIPGQATREPEIALAAWFFLATETEAPEVRESLRFEVFPLVPRERAYFQLWRNREGVYDFYTDEWVFLEKARAGADGSADPQPNPMLPCILALREWARRFELTSPHLMTVAVEVLLDWLYDEELRESEAPQDCWGLQLEFLAHGWSALPDGEELKEVVRAGRMNDALMPFCTQLTGRWEPRIETRQEFVKRMEERLADDLRQYLTMSEAILETRGFKKVPRKTARHHLTWLVQYRVCELTCEEIADRFAEQNPELRCPPTSDAVSKAIRRTAAWIELS